MLALEHEAKVTEQQDHHAFPEGFWAVVWTCLPESWGALLYPLQILTSDIPLVTILGMSATAQLWAIGGREMVPTPPISSALETPTPQLGREHQHCSSDQGAPTLKGPRQDKEEAANNEDMPEECPHRKCKEGKALKEPQKEAFSKESNIMKAARWVYQKTYQANVWQEGSYKRDPLLPDCLTHWVTKDHGPQGHPFHRGPAIMRQPDLLPLVQQRGSEWGNSGEPPAKHALPPGPCLCPLPVILHHQHGGHVLPCPWL